MAIFIKVLSAFLILCASILVIEAAISLKTSKLFLVNGDKPQFDCTGFTWNNKTEVIFNFNGLVVFNSTTNKTTSGVTKLNATSITLTSAAFGKGLVNAYCSAAKVKSPSISVIPYISPVTFSVNPKSFKVGKQFTATCTVTVLPSSQQYNVSYVKDSKIFAFWSLKGTTWTWNNVTAISGGNATQGKATSPTFTAVVNPITKQAAGKYSCLVTLPIGKSVQLPSNVWNNSAAVLPSFILLAITSFFAFGFEHLRY